MKHPLSTEAFADFLGRQPADRQYMYNAIVDCPIARYLRSVYGEEVFVGTANYNVTCNGPDKPMPEGWNDIVRDMPHTYGAAHARAKEVLK